MSLKNKLYICLTTVFILLMTGLTVFYLNSSKNKEAETKQVASNSTNKVEDKSSVKKESISSISDDKKSISDKKDESEKKEITSSSSNLDSSIVKTEEKKSSTDTINSEKTESSSVTETKIETTAPTLESATQTNQGISPRQYTFRYVYTAIGGDDLSTISYMTGVSVDTLAAVNSVPKNIVLKYGDKIYVP